jgi:hypothetical protein
VLSGVSSSLAQKVRLVYLPFLLASTLCVGGYTLLNWLLLERSGLFSLDEALVEFWIPYAIVATVVLVWIRPRIAVLQFGGWDRGAGFYGVMAGCAIAAPLIIAQIWLANAAGGMTHLDSADAIVAGPKTKNYTIANVAIEKARSSEHTIYSYPGRDHSTLQIACYFVCPFRIRPTSESVWLATVYNQHISSRLTDTERDAAIRAFTAQANRQYESENLTYASYFSRAAKNADLKGFEAALARNSQYRKAEPVTLLIRHTNDYASRSGNELNWVFGSFAVGASYCCYSCRSMGRRARGSWRSGAGRPKRKIES